MPNLTLHRFNVGLRVFNVCDHQAAIQNHDIDSARQVTVGAINFCVNLGRVTSRDFDYGNSYAWLMMAITYLSFNHVIFALLALLGNWQKLPPWLSLLFDLVTNGYCIGLLFVR